MGDRLSPVLWGKCFDNGVNMGGGFGRPVTPKPNQENRLGHGLQLVRRRFFYPQTIFSQDFSLTLHPIQMILGVFESQ